MGWLSKLVSGVKNILSGVEHFVRTTIDKFTRTKIFKALAIGAALWVGYGVATQGTSFFSTWGQPAAAAETTATTAAAPATTAATAATPAAAAAAPAAATAAPEAGGMISSSMGVAAPNAAPAFASVAPHTAELAASGGLGAPAGAGTVLAPTVDVAAAGKVPGFFSSDLAKYGAIQVGGGMISSAFTPNPTDEQMRLERQRYAHDRIAGYGGPPGTSGPVRIGNREYA